MGNIDDIKIFNKLSQEESIFVNHLKEVYNYSEKMLPKINSVFENYTSHDINHSICVANYILSFPKKTKQNRHKPLTSQKKMAIKS